jgi:hypothetical protein
MRLLGPLHSRALSSVEKWLTVFEEIRFKKLIW